MGSISILIDDQLLSGINHEKILQSMVETPNDHLREVNTVAGFLLYFKVSEEIKDKIIRAIPDKVGNEVEVYLPLILESALIPVSLAAS